MTKKQNFIETKAGSGHTAGGARKMAVVEAAARRPKNDKIVKPLTTLLSSISIRVNEKLWNFPRAGRKQLKSQVWRPKKC